MAATLPHIIYFTATKYDCVFKGGLFKLTVLSVHCCHTVGFSFLFKLAHLAKKVHSRCFFSAKRENICSPDSIIVAHNISRWEDVLITASQFHQSKVRIRCLSYHHVFALLSQSGNFNSGVEPFATDLFYRTLSRCLLATYWLMLAAHFCSHAAAIYCFL